MPELFLHYRLIYIYHTTVNNGLRTRFELRSCGSEATTLPTVPHQLPL